MDSEYEEELRAQLAILKEEHRDLDDVISKLMVTPPIDFLQLQRLKKRKLFLKDEIQKMESSLIPDIIA
jgi:hypothetical protein